MAYNLIEEMDKNPHSWGSVRSAKSSPKTGGICEVSVFEHMNSKVHDLYHKIDSLSITPPALVPPTHVASVAAATLYYEICEINGNTDKDFQVILVGGSIQENANFVNNNQRNDLYSNIYKLGWRDHKNFSYRNNHPHQSMEPLGFQKVMPTDPKKSNLEFLMENFVMI